MHQKHANLKRPGLGVFHRNEWAILGIPNNKIQLLVNQVSKTLNGKCSIAYVDADHANGDRVDMELPFGLLYNDKTHYHRFDFRAQLESYQYKQWLNEVDLTLVNGNHFLANQQIIVIDPVNEASLKRKLDRLTNVGLIVRTQPEQPLFTFLEEHLEVSQPNTQIPILDLQDDDGIAAFLFDQWRFNSPPLRGLVLAGGKSKRMGEDKGQIKYHGIPQREYMAQLINGICDQTFISCAYDQENTIASSYPILRDKLIGLGPFGAIATAFQYDPDAAWLVVACDLPLLNAATLEYLVHKRNRSKIATAYRSPVNAFPEPLVSIWEPRSYPILLQFLSQGYACPRKVLIHSNIELIEVHDPNTLKNVNHPSEREEVLQLLRKR